MLLVPPERKPCPTVQSGAAPLLGLAEEVTMNRRTFLIGASALALTALIGKRSIRAAETYTTTLPLVLGGRGELIAEWKDGTPHPHFTPRTSTTTP